jgi:superoxide dismutase, Fe-Mn family
VTATAREPSLAGLFNHASMAHNTHFFFKNLAARPTECPARLRAKIDEDFGSAETLRREVAATAGAMFGPGFVWLVKTVQRGGAGGVLKVLPTYLAGSPYPAAHWRRQGLDMNTVGGASGEGRGAALSWVNSQSNAARGSNVKIGGVDEDDRSPGGVGLVPLMCLSTWEHVWLEDYGFGINDQGGKRAYAEAWFNAIDWEKVDSLAQLDNRGFI